MIDVLATMLVFASFTGCVLSVHRFGGLLNPFLFMYSGFLLVSSVFLISPWGILADYNEEPFTAVGMLLIFITFSLIFFLISHKRPATLSISDGRYSFRLSPMKIVILAFSVELYCQYLLLEKNDFSIPIILMNSAIKDLGIGTHYSDYDANFFTPLSLAMARFMSVVVIIDLVLSGGALKDHFKKNKAMYSLMVIGIILSAMAGRRNILVWPLLCFLFAKPFMLNAKTNLYSRIQSGCLIIFLVFLFVALGYIRTGGSIETTMVEKFLPGMPLSFASTFLGNILTWLIIYAAPVIPNLETVAVGIVNPQYGMLTVSTLMPGVSFEWVSSSIDILKEADMIMFGQTFRSIMADLLVDFGWVFAPFVCLVFFGLGFVAWFRAHHSAYWFCILLWCIPGILMIPFINQFLGLPNLLPLLLGLLVMKKNRVENVLVVQYK